MRRVGLWLASARWNHIVTRDAISPLPGQHAPRCHLPASVTPNRNLMRQFRVVLGHLDPTLDNLRLIKWIPFDSYQTKRDPIARILKGRGCEMVQG